MIEGIRKTTLLDYPGHVACTLFTHGCNLRCPFCHNASLVVREKGDGISDEELFAFLEKRACILDGVCITGGEPLLQKDIKELIEKIRSYGYKIKLDTNGFFPEKLKDLLDGKLIDYVAMDIKSSKEGYAKATGIKNVDVTKPEQSVKLIMASGVDYEFRTTAVKGIHTEEDFKKISEWIKGAEKYFIQQFTDSGDIIESGFSAFDKGESEKLLSAVKELVPNAALRGV